MRAQMILAFSVLLAAPGFAQQSRGSDPSPTASSSAAAEVLALEKRIEAAVAGSDLKYLASVCSDDFVFSHGDGWTRGGEPTRVDNRESWLDALNGRYSVREVDQQQVELHGNVAVTRGRLKGEYTAGGTLEFWYVRVYGRADGEWKFLSHLTVEGPVRGGRADPPPNN